MSFTLFDQSPAKRRLRPTIIAGPCMAESPQLLNEIVSFLTPLAKLLDFELIFKASFDKANRTSGQSHRGPGIIQGLKWLGDVKSSSKLPILTDVHESSQVAMIAEVCEFIQIPAFLCRQTDLLIAAALSGRAVNIKKGQFLAPAATSNLVKKVHDVCLENSLAPKVALTERGTCFGYGDLLVDPRSLPIMSKTNAPVIFDVTHSLQQPASSGSTEATTGGCRQYAPTLTRAVIAGGYVDGLFLEVHPNPDKAMSDAKTQLNFRQAEALLRQCVPMLRDSATFNKIDEAFE